MIDYNGCRSALDTSLEALQSGATEFVDTVFENTEYEPVHGRGYLRSFLLPAEPKAASVGVNGVDYIAGIYQVDVAGSKNVGNGAILRKVDEVVAQFARGSSHTSNGVTVRVRRTWPGPAFERDGFYVVPVSVFWFLYG